MRHLIWAAGLLAWLFAGSALAAETASQAQAAPETGKPAETAKAPDITPKAADPLKAMCQLLAKHDAFSLTADIVMEQVYPNGQNVEVGRRVALVLKRPDKLYARITGDDRDRVFVYNGKTVAVGDFDKDVFAILDAPPTIDAMLDMLETQYGLVAPLADFLYSDPCPVLLDGVRTGDFVGEHQVGGRDCDHLVFAQSKTDWQLWVDSGRLPLPRKLVLTDKEVMGWPRYAVTFTDWNLNPRINAGQFLFTPPKNAHQIDFMPLVTPQGETK